MIRRFARLGRLATLALTLALGTLGIATEASAQQTPPSSDERARLHFQSGAAYYDAGEYESALREFESAFELSRRPQLFYNMYLCEQSLGNLEAAARHLAAYLEGVPEIENRDTLEVRLANLRERVARRAAGQADPGPTEEELEEERSREGETEAVTTDPEQVRIAEPAEPPSTFNVPAIASFGVAAVGLVGAAIFGPLAIVEDNTLAEGCGATRTCTESETSSLSTYALLTDISLGIALAGAIAGTVLLFVVDTGGGESAQAMRVAPFATTEAAGIVIGGAL